VLVAAGYVAHPVPRLPAGQLVAVSRNHDNIGKTGRFG
jgi:hypothetical protein